MAKRCDSCGHRIESCYICKGPIPAQRVRRDAITCSRECFKEWRKDKRIERKAVKKLREDLAAIRAGQEARNTVPAQGRAILSDEVSSTEFREILQVLSE